MNYSWPGNVRELQNAVERALILSGGKLLTFDDIASTRGDIPRRNQDLPEAPLTSLGQVVSAHIRKALDMTGGKVGGKGGAAERLLINPSTLRKKMKRLGIPFGRKAKPSQAQGNQAPFFSKG
jgi:DNA-binding NtrC family response regulator